MFFSTVNYYTKPNKITTLEFSTTKDYVKKTYTFPVILCENIKNKLKRDVGGSMSSVPLCDIKTKSIIRGVVGSV
jgi:hypothetical protein